MKQQITFLFTLCVTHLAIAQIVHIPDTNFKNALLTGTHSAIDTNNDGEIQYTEASAYTNPINVNAKNINDLTGIEAFTNIKILACSDNNLTKLDISKNTKLEMLFGMYNQINVLNIKHNPNLKTVYIYNNNLTRLVLANGNNSNITTFYSLYNPNLKCIEIDFGFTPPNSWVKDSATGYSNGCPAEIAQLDKSFLTSGTSEIESFSFQNVNIPDINFKNALLNHNPAIDTNGDGHIQVTEANSFTGYLNLGSKNIDNLIGIEKFTAVTWLNCSGNNLKKINLSKNTQLIFLFCSYNQIENLYLDKNTNLQYLYAWNNKLKRLDIANGNNTTLTYFNTENNPNLTCIQIDSGFTVPNTWERDSNVNFSNDCLYTAEAADPDIGFSILTPEANNEIIIFPNPTKNSLTISDKKNVIKHVEVYTLHGKKVIESKENKLDTSSLKKGIYEIKIHNKDNSITSKKIIKK